MTALCHCIADKIQDYGSVNRNTSSSVCSHFVGTTDCLEDQVKTNPDTQVTHVSGSAQEEEEEEEEKKKKKKKTEEDTCNVLSLACFGVQLEPMSVNSCLHLLLQLLFTITERKKKSIFYPL